MKILTDEAAKHLRMVFFVAETRTGRPFHGRVPVQMAMTRQGYDQVEREITELRPDLRAVCITGSDPLDAL